MNPFKFLIYDPNTIYFGVNVSAWLHTTCQFSIFVITVFARTHWTNLTLLTFKKNDSKVKKVINIIQKKIFIFIV